MLRNRRGATSLRWLRALLDHGIEVHGQVVVCPGVNDGAVLDDTLAGVLDRYPELAIAGRRAPRRQPLHRRGGRCGPHTVAEAGAVVDLVEDWQDVFLRRARPAARLRGRRVLPAGRPAVPRGRRLRGLPHARGRHRHGPRLRGRVRRARPTTPSAPQPGFFAWVDGAPAEGYRAPRAATGAVDRCTPRRRPRRSAILTGEYGAAVLAPLRRALGRDDVRVVPVENRVLRRQHRRHRPAGGRGPRPGAGRRARGPPLPAARRLPVERPVPRRHHARRPAPPGRGRADRRRRRCARALEPA